MSAATPRYVLEEAHVAHGPPHLVPLEALQEKRHAQYSGRYAGHLGGNAYMFDAFVETVFFRGQERRYGLFAIHDYIHRAL
jgi:hypothetical protein